MAVMRISMTVLYITEFQLMILTKQIWPADMNNTLALNTNHVALLVPQLIFKLSVKHILRLHATRV